VKDPAPLAEIATLAPLVRNDLSFQIESKYELAWSLASIKPQNVLVPYIGLVAWINPASRDRIPDDRDGKIVTHNTIICCVFIEAIDHLLCFY